MFLQLTIADTHTRAIVAISQILCVVEIVGSTDCNIRFINGDILRAQEPYNLVYALLRDKVANDGL